LLLWDLSAGREGFHSLDRDIRLRKFESFRGIRIKTIKLITSLIMRGINQIKTAGLLGLLSGLLVLAGYYLVGNEQGLYLGLAFAAFTSFSSWYYSDRAALMAYRAQPLAREQAPELYEMVASLSAKAEIPMPKLFFVPNGDFPYS
jgi:hypothetical protein